MLLWRWCWQMPAPPHSLHLSLSRSCGQPLRALLRSSPPAASPHRRRLPAPPAAPGPASEAARSPAVLAAATALLAPPSSPVADRFPAVRSIDRGQKSFSNLVRGHQLSCRPLPQPATGLHLGPAHPHTPFHAACQLFVFNGCYRRIQPGHPGRRRRGGRREEEEEEEGGGGRRRRFH